MEDAAVYITAQGARLARVGERMLVRSREGKILNDVPFFRVQEIICMGSVDVTHSALMALQRRSIDVVFLTMDGRFKCRVSNLQPRAVRCRMRQYERASDPEFRLRVSREMVRGKLGISRVWLMRQNRNRDEILAGQVIGVKDCLDALDDAKTVDELMGIEGTAARYHFEGLRCLLKQDLGFAGRVRRPPTDPVNAMLSFGYTLLFNRVLSAVERAGLDPMLSNLHAIDDRRASLALDLMEEFRTLVVDSTVLSLVNRIEMVPGDFRVEDGKGVRMSEGAIARFVKGIQSRLSDSVTHPVNGKSYALKDLITQQAWQYKSVVLGEAAEYKPVTTR
ncbi:MAG: CRISPR-associated endonuclease Cas1 [Candidatus Riflebacteria bacterium]|nr:CRISPR-associated endonuclease Cas1 [Candidatus Riflebacteria bacterium]